MKVEVPLALLGRITGVFVLSGFVSAAIANELVTALRDAKPLVDVRVRVEHVEQTPLADESDAMTLRARLGFETGKVLQTSLLAEAEGVTPLESDYRPDPSVAASLTYPVVPDPEGYEINRLHLSNTSIPGTTLTLGRQRILLDDHRFVGNVGWRQNEQTFDALRAINKSIPNFVVDLTYFNQVNRVFGPDSPQGRYEGDSYLANIAYQTPIGKLTAFAYLLDFDPLRIPRLTPAQQTALNPVRQSTDTFGLRVAGERAVSSIKFNYVAAYAEQVDAGENPLTFDLAYYTAEVTAGFGAFSLGIGQEVLEGNGTIGFSTPLATLHRFQGWADKFLTTPAAGIDDRYINAGYSAKAVGPFDTLNAVVGYRTYDAELGSLDLGDEVNLQLQGKWQRFLFTLKWADYNADEEQTPAAYQDTSKYWIQVDYTW